MGFITKRIIAKIEPKVPSRLRPLWEHPAGPKTIFFWAPLSKWGVVLAGISDLKRPANSVSITQTMSILANGLVWARYATVVTPRNWSLCLANCFVFSTQYYQLNRIFRFKFYGDAD